MPHFLLSTGTGVVKSGTQTQKFDREKAEENKLLISLPLVLTAVAANAQSSVALYGIIDTGIDYVNNQTTAQNGQAIAGSGGATVRESSGVPLGSRWGLLGGEDLGAGLKAIFRLESGFSSVNGSLGGSNQIFSRNAYVGVQSEKLGTVTFGKQWDTIVDMLEPFSLNGNYGGYYFAHPNDMDNMDNRVFSEQCCQVR